MAGQTAIAADVKGDLHVEGVVTDEGRGWGFWTSCFLAPGGTPA